MRYLAILFICFYQKFLSPYKGFRCAHAFLYKGDSCSEAIKKIIKKHGVFAGYRQIRYRLNDCKKAYVQVSSKSKNDREKKDKCDSCYDPGVACDVGDCLLKDHCDVPDLPCDCSL